MYFIIYKITNSVNEHFYIGAHKTNDLRDDYFGSGKKLEKAIEKYGVENFVKTILFFCKNIKELYRKEAKIVDSNLLDDKNCYNIRLGGYGGFEYINKSKLNVPLFTKENGKYYSKRGTRVINFLIKNDPLYKKNLIKASYKGILKQKQLYPNGLWKGKKHTKESKDKISNSEYHKNLQGFKNSMYGRKWIRNDVLNLTKPVKTCELNNYFNNGWKLGRKNKNNLIQI